MSIIITEVVGVISQYVAGLNVRLAEVQLGVAFFRVSTPEGKYISVFRGNDLVASFSTSEFLWGSLADRERMLSTLRRDVDTSFAATGVSLTARQKFDAATRAAARTIFS